jgi:hypothetical protein
MFDLCTSHGSRSTPHCCFPHFFLSFFSMESKAFCFNNWSTTVLHFKVEVSIHAVRPSKLCIHFATTSAGGSTSSDAHEHTESDHPLSFISSHVPQLNLDGHVQNANSYGRHWVSSRFSLQSAMSTARAPAGVSHRSTFLRGGVTRS